jgi:hypothetical protein
MQPRTTAQHSTEINVGLLFNWFDDLVVLMGGGTDGFTVEPKKKLLFIVVSEGTR